LYHKETTFTAIHIPFCKKACHYCNFHFSTSLQYKNEVIENLLKEIELRKDYLENEDIETIYLGGGTPSLLSKQELEIILEKIHRCFKIKDEIEFTLEANPDDLTFIKVKELKEVGINRLSIGIQSFFDEDLQYMNRSHDVKQAETCIELIREAGINNFSVDLIFGFPILTDDKWKKNIETALQYQIPHLSCYAMTVEPKTALASFIKSKKTQAINHEQSARQFEYLMAELQNHGYEQYEISNYALPGKMALHNSNYWNGIPYLGIGPSAHSYNGVSRQWNVSNNATYIRSLNENKIPFEIEILTDAQKLNEQIMTALRTMKGLHIDIVKNKIGTFQFEAWYAGVDHFKQQDMLRIENNFIRLTQKGKLFADHIAGELFI
jgi:oxygen-independent coproporphyrinogen-3 oxidase